MAPSAGTRMITSIDVHAEGEVGRVLTGAHHLVRGTTWSERIRWCETAPGQVPVAHPEQPDITEIALAMLHGSADSPEISGRNSVILPSGRITLDDPTSWTGTLDRSPGGTGASARMAALHARGELGLRVPFVHEGVLGTTFRGMLHERTTVGGDEAVLPSIQGRAWITGYVRHVVAPDDPFPTGLTVGDTWSPVPDYGREHGPRRRRANLHVPVLAERRVAIPRCDD